MGQAGDSLARYLEVFVYLSVPEIKLVDSAELATMLDEAGEEGKKISAVRQAFYNSEDANGMRGEAIMSFNDAAFASFADLLDYETLGQDSESEILLDITNILNSTCLNGIAEQMEFDLAYSPPSIIGRKIEPSAVVRHENMDWDQALLVRIHYTIEDHKVDCSMMLLMPGEAVESVLHSLDQLLDDMD